MKTRKRHQVVPAIIMTGAAAVPIVTTAEILVHANRIGSAGGPVPSAPVAIAPPQTSSQSGAPSARTASGGTQTYRGPVINDPFGGVQATITVAGKKITNVVISAPQDNPRSAMINQQAVPLLRSETLQAQSAQVNTVSGATYTSQAYAQSLQAALDQAHSQGHAVTAATSTGSTQQASSVSLGEDD